MWKTAYTVLRLERKDVIRDMMLHRIHGADIDEMIYGSGKTVVSER